MSGTHYIFVDFENVQSVKLDLIAGKPVSVVLVVGKDQTKVPLSLVEQLMEHRDQVKLIRTEVKGKNALDFVLAGEVGSHVANHPSGSFHIVSRDKGFDALISHLRASGREAARHDTFAKVPILGAAPTARKSAAMVSAAPKKKSAAATARQPATARASAPIQKFERMKTRLAPGSANRPKRLKALLGLMKDQAGPLTEAESAALLEKLKSAGLLSISEQGAVTYKD